MLSLARKPILQTVILCLCTLLITFPKHGGFMLGFVFIFLLPSILKNLYFIFVKNTEKHRRSIQTLLWLATFSVVITHHLYLYKNSQNFGLLVSDAIVKYHKNNNVYPSSAEILGFDKQDMKEHGLHYSNKDKTPFLFYSATWIIYDTYTFNFENNEWDFQKN